MEDGAGVRLKGFEKGEVSAFTIASLL